MTTRYKCPHCSNDDYYRFVAVHSVQVVMHREYPIGYGHDEDGEEIISDDTPETYYDEGASHEHETNEIGDDFQHYQCENCGAKFDSFIEVEEDEDEDDEDDEDDDSVRGQAETLLVTLTKDNLEEAVSFLRELLEDEEVTLPSDVSISIKNLIATADMKAVRTTLERITAL